MSSTIDMVGAAILFGVLILTVARIQGNLNSTMYQNTFNVSTQAQAVALARVIEYEVQKAGYGVTGLKITVAESQKIAFRGAMSFEGVVDSISYYTGEADTSTTNPDDFRFVRYARSSGPLSQRLGMTQFQIMYYDTGHTQMTAPVIGAAALRAIRGIKIKFCVEGSEPVIDAMTGLSSYNNVTWEKLMLPRNLGRPF